MCVRAGCVATESLQLSHVCTILYLVCVAVAILVFFLGGLVLFAGLAAGLLAGVSTQFIQCGEYRSAVKVSTRNNFPPQSTVLSFTSNYPLSYCNGCVCVQVACVQGQGGSPGEASAAQVDSDRQGRLGAGEVSADPIHVAAKRSINSTM